MIRGCNGGINEQSDKSVDIYERLAAALEALPHGFPRTTSGVEMKLIKMAFTPEEVSLAGQLTRFPETAAEIAKRVGMDVADVTAVTREPDTQTPGSPGLTRDGSSRPGAYSVEGEKKYRLGPFLVGWYEANMRLLDKEFAELFEQYVIEGGGERILSPRPGVLGVVPVRGSLKPELMEVMEPHLDIDAHFKRHERFLVIPCVCKREQEVLQGHRLQDAHEALRLCRTAASDPAWGNRARPGGGVTSSLMSSSRWGTFTWRSMDSPWERRLLSSSARVTAAVLLRYSRRNHAPRSAGSGAAIELPRRR